MSEATPQSSPGSAAVEVLRLGRSLAAEVRQVDLSELPTAAQLQGLHDALLEHEVLIFRDQAITSDQQMAFGRMFGELTVHPFSPNLADRPELIVLDNHQDNPPRLTDVWHSDETFRDEPPMGTMLRAIITPRRGGDTLFASMSAAFDGLSDRL